MCLRIWEAALAVQGPYGALAADTVRFRNNDAAPDSKLRSRAYWATVEGLGIGCPPPAP